MLLYSEVSENNYFALLLQMDCGGGGGEGMERKERESASAVSFILVFR